VEFDKNLTLFTSKLAMHLRKKLVKCYIWYIAFHGAETCTDQNTLKVLTGGGGAEGWRRSVVSIVSKMK
jgi:hypothetical protein